MSFRFSLLACASLTALMMAAPARGETLEDAARMALSGNPRVGAAQANSEALSEEERERRSDYFPQVSVNAAGGRVYGDNSTSRGLSVTRGAGYSWLWEGGATVSQPLFTGFETGNRVDAAAARHKSAYFNISDVKEKTALQAVIAYLDVLRSRESLERLKAHDKKIGSYIGRIEKMVADGGADEATAVQARDIRAQLESTVAATEGQLRNAIAVYEEIIGQKPGDTLAPAVLGQGEIPADVAQAVAYARENHPLLQSAQQTGESYAYEADAEKSAYYPKVLGELSYLERDQDDVIGGELTDAKAVVRMNWNYAVGGAQQARVRKNLRRQDESHAQLQEIERQIEREIDVAYSDYKTAEEQLAIQRSRTQLNRDLLKTQNVQFEAAKVNLLQLLQTENALFNADFAQMNSEYKLQGSQFVILASMGRLQQALNLQARKQVVAAVDPLPAPDPVTTPSRMPSSEDLIASPSGSWK